MNLYVGVALAKVGNYPRVHYCEAVTWFYARDACMREFDCEQHEVDACECTEAGVRKAIACTKYANHEHITIDPVLLERYAPKPAKKPKRKR